MTKIEFLVLLNALRITDVGIPQFSLLLQYWMDTTALAHAMVCRIHSTLGEAFADHRFALLPESLGILRIKRIATYAPAD